MARPLLTVPAIGALAALCTFAAPPATSAADPVVDAAIGFIAASQQPDGGFEVAGFPGFETPDAVLALAEAGQTGTTWSTAEALAAVQAIQTGAGLDGLDALDDLADGGIDAGQAAKLIVLVAAPLGLAPTDFDPSDDSTDPVDLVATMDAGQDFTFSALLYTGLAQPLIGRSVPDNTIEAVLTAQQANGGWNFAGDPTMTEVDPDTTGLAVQVLAAADTPPADAIATAVAMLGGAHWVDGGWRSPFDVDQSNPNSTALATLAVTAAGYDPAIRCWRDVAAPAGTSRPYHVPDDYVAEHQDADGHIAGPSDQFGVNTFGTSQAVQGLLRSWLPLGRVTAGGCAVSPVERLYPDLLGRDADPDGTAYFTQVANDSGYPFVAGSLLGSDEHRAHTVSALYQTYLDRDADPDGTAYFTGLLAGGMPDQLVRAQLLGSGEYAAQDGGAVVNWYRDVLGREPAAEEAEFWVEYAAQIGNGPAALALLNTDEARGRFVDAAYADLLGRDADDAGRSYFNAVLGATQSVDAVVAALASSTEYIAGANA